MIKKYAQEAISIVVLLTGMFGSYLLEISPPEKTLKFIAGFCSVSGFLLYLLLIVIKNAIAQNLFRKIFLAIGIIGIITFSLFAFNYNDKYNNLVFTNLDNKIVGCGNNSQYLTPITKEEIANGVFRSAIDKIKQISPDNKDDVWITGSVPKCKKSLSIAYYKVMISFFFAAFTLLMLAVNKPKE